MSEVIAKEENDDIVPLCGTAEHLISVIDGTRNNREIRRKGLSLSPVKGAYEKSSIHRHDK